MSKRGVSSSPIKTNLACGIFYLAQPESDRKMEKDSLSSALITHNLETRFIGQRVLYYPQLSSTMDIARQEALRGAAEGTVVVADEQIGGRGRVKRVWLSPEGSIALSIILYPGVINSPYLIMLASLAVVHSIEVVAGLKAQIKWPNDVLISDKKVCGILIESNVRGDTVDYTIISIGLNVNFRLSGFPEIQDTATSLSDELGEDLPRLKVVRQLLKETEKLYLALRAGESCYEEWRDRLVTLGNSVRVKSGGAIYEGVAESVVRDGSLLLRCTDGNLLKIVSGDATLRI